MFKWIKKFQYKVVSKHNCEKCNCYGVWLLLENGYGWRKAKFCGDNFWEWKKETEVYVNEVIPFLKRLDNV